MIRAFKVAARLSVALPTVIIALGKLHKLHVVRETTRKQRNRSYVYSQYLDILNEEAMLI